MKKLFFLPFLITFMHVNAQGYLISFNPADDTSVISSILVENLTAGTSLTLNGTDILRLGIPSVIIPSTGDLPLIAYPNPFVDHATLKVNPPSAVNAEITAYDAGGRVIARMNRYLSGSPREIQISCDQSGSYFVVINGPGYRYTGKLLCSGQGKNSFSMTLAGDAEASQKTLRNAQVKSTMETVDMAFTEGDRLKFTATNATGDKTVKAEIPDRSAIISFDFVPCTDFEGYHYATVKIGNQVWMAENLQSTKFDNGTEIPLVTDTTTWYDITTPAYTWYRNDEAANRETYGALYNWASVDTGLLCPAGWHVPSDDEWGTMGIFLGATDAGYKLKEMGTAHWADPNAGATDEYGFTALPGGYMMSEKFQEQGQRGGWWTSTIYDVGFAYYIYIHAGGDVPRDEGNMGSGMSVRCVKDE